MNEQRIEIDGVICETRIVSAKEHNKEFCGKPQMQATKRNGNPLRYGVVRQFRRTKKPSGSDVLLGCYGIQWAKSRKMLPVHVF